MKCKICNSNMYEFLMDKFICPNSKCEKHNIIQVFNEDGDPID